MKVPFCERSSSHASSRGAPGAPIGDAGEDIENEAPGDSAAAVAASGQRISLKTRKCWLLMYGIGALCPMRIVDLRDRPIMYSFVHSSRHVSPPSGSCGAAGGSGLRPTSVPHV